MKDIENEILKIRKLPNNFFNPNISDINNPKDLLNIDKASEVFYNYINNDKKITIVIDVDIDGIMATTIMYKWLEKYGKNNVKICHHQRNMGHGVIPDRVNKTDLLIVVDSSSNSISEVEEILKNNKAKDILILDHHETNNIMISDGYIEENDNYGNDVLTPNYKYDAEMNRIEGVILINPHQPEDEYLNKDLSGAMVCFKFLEYIESKYNIKEYTKELMDFAAISIISDVMNVSNMENRYYYYNGCEAIKNLGLANLMDKLRADCFNVNSTDIAFKLNKAINSTLRLQDILSVFRLILNYKTEDDDILIDKILKNIKLRENIENDIISSISILHDSYGVILAQNNYSGDKDIANNFNGVIASKMVEEHKKNVVIVNSSLRGSCRGYNGFNFKDYINESGFAVGAGHQGAFGIEIKDLESLKRYIIDHPPIIKKSEEYDIEIKLKDLSKTFFKEIMRIQYLTGNGFDKIKFKIPDITIKEIKETSGNNKYYITDKSKQYIRFLDKLSVDKNIKVGNEICVYCTLNINNFFGKDYYECSCYNIDITSNLVDDEWGFLE